MEPTLRSEEPAVPSVASFPVPASAEEQSEPVLSPKLKKKPRKRKPKRNLDRNSDQNSDRKSERKTTKVLESEIPQDSQFLQKSDQNSAPQTQNAELGEKKKKPKPSFEEKTINKLIKAYKPETINGTRINPQLYATGNATLKSLGFEFHPDREYSFGIRITPEDPEFPYDLPFLYFTLLIPVEFSVSRYIPKHVIAELLKNASEVLKTVEIAKGTSQVTGKKLASWQSHLTDRRLYGMLGKFQNSVFSVSRIPRIVVLNDSIPKGFSANIERGFDLLVRGALQSCLRLPNSVSGAERRVLSDFSRLLDEYIDWKSGKKGGNGNGKDLMPQWLRLLDLYHQPQFDIEFLRSVAQCQSRKSHGVELAELVSRLNKSLEEFLSQKESRTIKIVARKSKPKPKPSHKAGEKAEAEAEKSVFVQDENSGKNKPNGPKLSPLSPAPTAASTEKMTEELRLLRNRLKTTLLRENARQTVLRLKFQFVAQMTESEENPEQEETTELKDTNIVTVNPELLQNPAFLIHYIPSRILTVELTVPKNYPLVPCFVDLPERQFVAIGTEEAQQVAQQTALRISRRITGNFNSKKTSDEFFQKGNGSLEAEEVEKRILQEFRAGNSVEKIVNDVNSVDGSQVSCRHFSLLARINFLVEKLETLGKEESEFARVVDLSLLRCLAGK